MKVRVATGIVSAWAYLLGWHLRSYCSIWFMHVLSHVFHALKSSELAPFGMNLALFSWHGSVFLCGRFGLWIPGLSTWTKQIFWLTAAKPVMCYCCLLPTAWCLFKTRLPLILVIACVGSVRFVFSSLLKHHVPMASVGLVRSDKYCLIPICPLWPWQVFVNDSCGCSLVQTLCYLDPK